ncbi:unnamed protein product, partial [Mesorhabditis belari]|uniref:Uncharacterized protein n=1 Tax=Mesorhabditis belari TaxID=2138241 RepID=A0AAF3F9D4_9BILA
MAINFFLLSIFLGYPLFRKKYQLLILLAVGDGINGLAIILTGLNRVYLYSTALETLTLPVRTPWECAVEVWIIMKLVGDLLLPITTLCMGIERLVAILFPIFFHQRLDGRPIK